MHTVMETVLKKRVITIVRGLAPEHMEGLAEALAKGGIGMMEVTFDQRNPQSWKDTAAAIHLLATRFAGVILPGAGTVLTPEQARMAHDAGAQYIISPNVDADVIGETRALGMASMPGALTPTEVVAAWQAGADAVKVFPAGSMGPEYIKALKAPLAHIPLMAVGGIAEETAADFMKAGAIGLGIGGSLVNHAWIAAGEWGKITAAARVYCQAAGVTA